MILQVLNIRGWIALGLTVTGLTVAAVYSGSLSDADPDRRPVEGLNVVIILADDLGWNDVGAYGNENIQTPHIDALADGGMRFTNAFLTTSSCSPSRASILTGRYPHNTGAMHLHQPLPPEQLLVAKVFKDAGYYTASAGKWHLGSAAKAAFDRVRPVMDPSGAAGWVSVLRSRPKDKPFFLWLAASDPHPPHDDDSLANRHSIEAVTIPPYLVDTPGTREEFVPYYDEISRLDDYVGSLMGELKRQGVLQKTIVVFMSDNGRPFFRGKSSLYDSGIKTPFVVSWPGRLASGQLNHQLVSAIDIAPTLLDVAALKIPESMQGQSFRNSLLNPEETTRDYVFAEQNWHGKNVHERAVRSHDFLYIQNQRPDRGRCLKSIFKNDRSFQALEAAYQEGLLDADRAKCFAKRRAKEELYDVRVDPYSLKNLADDPDHEDVLIRYRALLDEWRQATNDPDFERYRPPHNAASAKQRESENTPAD